MKNVSTTAASLLIGNLWQAKPEVVSKLQQQPAVIPSPLGLVKWAQPSPRALASSTDHCPIRTSPPLTLPPPPINLPPDPENSGLLLQWSELQVKVSQCQECRLCQGRRNVVIERGNRQAKWMFIGEGPGEQEDLQGKPFVGASGQLLDKMLAALNLDPARDVYIANVVKCRPPHNRNPDREEVAACSSYLFSQIALLRPQIIITLGRLAAQTILDTEVAVGKLRGRVNHYQQIPVIVTYHPSYLLRNPLAKKDAWADLQLALHTFVSHNS